VQRGSELSKFCVLRGGKATGPKMIKRSYYSTYTEMPRLESKLLYRTAQQTNPWRAGTPGRAPWNWRAVVFFKRRPLRLSIPQAFCVFALVFTATPAFGQARFPDKLTVQLRLGAFGATNLVSDEVSSRAVDDSIPGDRSDGVAIRQKPGPIGTLAVRFPLRTSTQLEVNASAARSMVQGDDGLEQWDVANATIANFVVGFGYLYRRAIAIRAGVGLTKIFAEERGVFSRGNGVKPLLEGGIASGIMVGGRPIELDVRAQTHSFGTATLRDNGGANGNVTRVVVQLGTTLWKAGN
jgi:hypothetical protein